MIFPVLVHDQLLDDRQDVLHEPVENETAGKLFENPSEDDGHDQEHPALRRIRRRRRDDLLHEHRHGHEDRKDVGRILHRKVVNP